MRPSQNTTIFSETSGATATRRGFLQAPAWFVAPGGLLTGRRASGGEVVSPATNKLSAYMSEARSQALPDEVLEKVKHHILDTFAAMISGSQLPPGRAAERFARVQGGAEIATVTASKVLCGAADAAFANGVLAHSDETDDSHAPSQSHPGCAVIPAALAAGEHFGIAGMDFLRSVALGYDIGSRVSMTLGGREFQTRTHRDSHSLANGFGAAAAAGCAANLNARQMRWLLDYAAQQTGGIAAWQRDVDHMEKAFVFAGMTARNGVTAALLVQSGWSGVDDIMSGSDNFLLANTPDADPNGLIEKLGQRFEVVRTNIKKWSVGSPIQAPLDALDILRKRHGFQAGQVQQVIVRVATREATVVNNREMPDICLQHMIAVMLVDGTVSFSSAHDKVRMKDAAILRERAKVQLISDEELEGRLPRREAIVEIIFNDNTHVRERVEAVRGTAENPMTREEVVAKSRDLIAPVFGMATCTNLIAAVFRLKNLKDIRELRPLLQGR